MTVETIHDLDIYPTVSMGGNMTTVECSDGLTSATNRAYLAQENQVTIHIHVYCLHIINYIL